MAKRGGAREGSGRKKMEGVVYTSIRVYADDWERIPKPKAEFVRQAVAEKLEREEVEAMKTVTKADVITQFAAIGDLLGIDLSEVVTDDFNKNYVAYAMAQVLVAELQERIR